MGELVNASVHIEGKANVTGRLQGRLNLANEKTPRFDELMCALGKLLVAFNILEQEIKHATAFVLDPSTSDLLNPEVSKRKKLEGRINRLKELCRAKLQAEQAIRLDEILDRAKKFPDIRNFPAHSYVYPEGKGFTFRNIGEKGMEIRLTSPEQMMEQVGKFLDWTDEFANLFKELFHDYSSWFIRQTTPDQ